MPVMHPMKMDTCLLSPDSEGGYRELAARVQTWFSIWTVAKLLPSRLAGIKPETWP